MPSRKIGPPRRGSPRARIARSQVNSAGTKRSWTEKSQLPVPFSPATRQLSCSVAEAAGIRNMRSSGESLPSMRAPAISHSAWGAPLANWKRPESR